MPRTPSTHTKSFLAPPSTPYAPTPSASARKAARLKGPRTPTTDADSTLTGTKTEKRKQIGARIRAGLEQLAPKRPQVDRSGHAHEGYRVTGPFMSVGGGDILDAGRWYQICIPVSGKGERRCFQWLSPRLSSDVLLHSEPLASWWLIRAELQPKARNQIQPPLERPATPANARSTAYGPSSSTQDTGSDSEIEFCDTPAAVRAKLSQTCRLGRAVLEDKSIPISDSEDEVFGAEGAQSSKPSVTALRDMESGSRRVDAPNDLDNNVVVTIMAWHSDLHPPSYVAVSARRGKRLVLDDHKMAVGRIGLDGPVERYVEPKRQWLSLRWDTPLLVCDGALVLLRARGVKTMIDWAEHTQHVLDEGLPRNVRARGSGALPDFRSSSPPLLSSPLDRVLRR